MNRVLWKFPLCKIVLAAFVMVFASNAIAAEDIPPELAAAKSRYELEIKTALEPLRERYLDGLVQLKKTLGGKGDLEGATAAQKEEDLLKSGEQPDASDTSGPNELKSGRSWFKQQSKLVTDPIKNRYAAALEAVKKTLGGQGNVAGALAAQKEIDSLQLNSHNWVIGNGKLVIWNTNNRGKGDRGTKRINVAFVSGGKEVWRRNDIVLKWHASKDTKDIIDTPTGPIEKVRIEIVEAVNKKAGLSEVELFDGGTNLTRDCKVESSAVWENNLNYAASNLTDGVKEPKKDEMGFWLLPDNQVGWAEILLKEKK